jgi:hypothetical protein
VEGDDALPDLLAVLGVADGGRVPRRGAQVQRVAAVAAAAMSGRKGKHNMSAIQFRELP